MSPNESFAMLMTRLRTGEDSAAREVFVRFAARHVGCVLFTNPRTGEMRDRFDHPTGDQGPVAVTPDGRRVAVAGANGEVVVWDVAERRKRVYRGHPGRVLALAFGPVGRRAAGGGDRAVRVWDTGSEQDIRTLAWVGDGAGTLSLAPNGARLAVGPRAPRRRPLAYSMR